MAGRDWMSLGLLLAVMVAQVMIVNRVPLPWQVAPDLALLGVVGYALVRGPEAGTVMGFTAGLASDLLPPVAHVMGQHALVLCLLGFVAGRVAEARPQAGPMVALACAAAGPPAMVAAGGLLGEVQIIPETLGDVLPTAVLCNMVAAPPMVWAVTRIVRGSPRTVSWARYAVRSQP
ncbi:rod shape-determining protein MreD [Planobispora siamensis]|uniref:Rod shape-determining protein MreD n=1 Tax=Planobispora siamensis TaxID=936338 RepID=A0A8J3WJ25_9ACTN|nr:rod shape-determining protein MreD [Planobispora siamensis]GIH90302.1 hypothetical protein Psi01_09320 [Planobispora siamensis]